MEAKEERVIKRLQKLSKVAKQDDPYKVFVIRTSNKDRVNNRPIHVAFIERNIEAAILRIHEYLSDPQFNFLKNQLRLTLAHIHKDREDKLSIDHLTFCLIDDLQTDGDLWIEEYIVR